MAVAAPPEMLKSSPDLLRKEPAKRRSCSPDSSPTKQARTQEFRTDKVIIGILNRVFDPDLHPFYLMVYYIYIHISYIFFCFCCYLSTIGVWIPIQILKYGSSLCFGILILISKMCLTIVLLCYICAGRVFLRVVWEKIWPEEEPFMSHLFISHRRRRKYGNKSYYLQSNGL